MENSRRGAVIFQRGFDRKRKCDTIEIYFTRGGRIGHSFMNRILTYRIEENTDIENFLRKLGFSKKQISALKFRENGIRVNGSRRRVTEKLQPGDLLEILVEEEGKSSSQLIPAEGMVSVLYEDEDLMVVDKPAGILVHPSGGHYQDTLANQLMGYFQKRD